MSNSHRIFAKTMTPRHWPVITLLCALALVGVPADASPRATTLIDAATVVPGLIVDARYAGSHNFVGRPIDGYRAPRCLLTQAAANALAEVARDLTERGLRIKVFDCYRDRKSVV